MQLFEVGKKKHIILSGRNSFTFLLLNSPFHKPKPRSAQLCQLLSLTFWNTFASVSLNSDDRARHSLMQSCWVVLSHLWNAESTFLPYRPPSENTHAALRRPTPWNRVHGFTERPEHKIGGCGKVKKGRLREGTHMDTHTNTNAYAELVSSLKEYHKVKRGLKASGVS